MRAPSPALERTSVFAGGRRQGSARDRQPEPKDAPLTDEMMDLRGLVQRSPSPRREALERKRYEAATERLAGAILLEQNAEWADRVGASRSKELPRCGFGRQRQA